MHSPASETKKKPATSPVREASVPRGRARAEMRIAMQAGRYAGYGVRPRLADLPAKLAGLCSERHGFEWLALLLSAPLHRKECSDGPAFRLVLSHLRGKVLSLRSEAGGSLGGSGRLRLRLLRKIVVQQLDRVYARIIDLAVVDLSDGAEGNASSLRYLHELGGA